MTEKAHSNLSSVNKLPFSIFTLVVNSFTLLRLESGRLVHFSLIAFPFKDLKESSSTFLTVYGGWIRCELNTGYNRFICETSSDDRVLNLKIEKSFLPWLRREHFWLRSLRKSHGIRRGMWNDCVISCFCYPCVLCQMKNHLDDNKESKNDEKIETYLIIWVFFAIT